MTTNNIRDDPVLKEVARIDLAVYREMTEPSISANDFFQKYLTPKVLEAFGNRNPEQAVFDSMSKLFRYVSRYESGEPGKVDRIEVPQDRLEGAVWEGIAGRKDEILRKVDSGEAYRMKRSLQEVRATSAAPA